MPDLLNQIGRDSAVREELAESWGMSDIRYFNSTESTQKIARALADAGAPGWTLIVADHQTSGIGRNRSAWFSQPGTSILFSLLLRPERPEALPLLPVRIGLIVARSIEAILASKGAVQEDETKVFLKWPNDIIVDSGKMGGILVEGVTRGNQQYVLAGLGLNVFRFVNAPGELANVDLRFLDDYLPDKANRLTTLERIVTDLREQLRTVPEDLMPSEVAEYAVRDWLRGKRIVSPMPGVVAGINRKGHLLLQNGDSELETISAGSVRLASEQG